MKDEPQTGDKQSKLWNGAAGTAWVESKDLLDRMFKPFEDILVEAVSARSAKHVLDVGCGTGATTLGIARRLGRNARCTGIDISEPMLATARAHAAYEGIEAGFIRANAQTHRFEAASFDTIVSRFGVMFFDDPVVAFRNLRHASTEGAQLRMMTWRSAAENPFMTEAERAAAPLLPDLPSRDPDGPGQFAFADADRVRRILEESGWAGIDLRPVDIDCSFPEPELVRYLTRLGPLGLALDNADEKTRARVVEAVLEAFSPYVKNSQVVFTAACWNVVAGSSSMP